MPGTIENEAGTRLASFDKNAEYPPPGLALLDVIGISAILARAESPLIGRAGCDAEIILDGGNILSPSPGGRYGLSTSYEN